MKVICISITACMVICGAIFGGDAPKSTTANVEAVTLAEACKLVALMNEDKWDDVTKVIDTGSGALATLQIQARIKDWPGIGAYRGTEVDKTSPRVVTHRFGFVPRSSPHEVLITYTLSDSGFSKPRMAVLGW